MCRRWITTAKKPRLLIIDTMARVKSSKTSDQTVYEADYDSVMELKALADEYGIAIVLVHHQRKMTADDPIDTVSGSTGLTGAVDTVLVLHQTSRGPTLYGRGRDIEEIETALEFDRETCKWRALGDADDVHRTDERSAILHVLREAEQPMSPAQIAERTNMPRNNVRQLLYKMVQRGEVRKEGRGKYVQPEREEADNNDNQ
jgi:hypothetical protein